MERKNYASDGSLPFSRIPFVRQTFCQLSTKRRGSRLCRRKNVFGQMSVGQMFFDEMTWSRSGTRIRINFTSRNEAENGATTFSQLAILPTSQKYHTCSKCTHTHTQTLFRHTHTYSYFISLTHTHTHIHTYIHTHTHIHTHIYTYTHTYA